MTAQKFFSKKSDRIDKGMGEQTEAADGIVKQQMEQRGVCGWRRFEVAPKQSQQGGDWMTE
jgi:hypothetical protein